VASSHPAEIAARVTAAESAMIAGFTASPLSSARRCGAGLQRGGA
jgi:hypothetical protein